MNRSQSDPALLVHPAPIHVPQPTTCKFYIRYMYITIAFNFTVTPSDDKYKNILKKYEEDVGLGVVLKI